MLITAVIKRDNVYKHHTNASTQGKLRPRFLQSQLLEPFPVGIKRDREFCQKLDCEGLRPYALNLTANFPDTKAGKEKQDTMYSFPVCQEGIYSEVRNHF